MTMTDVEQYLVANGWATTAAIDRRRHPSSSRHLVLIYGQKTKTSQRTCCRHGVCELAPCAFFVAPTWSATALIQRKARCSSTVCTNIRTAEHYGGTLSRRRGSLFMWSRGPADEKNDLHVFPISNFSLHPSGWSMYPAVLAHARVLARCLLAACSWSQRQVISAG